MQAKLLSREDLSFIVWKKLITVKNLADISLIDRSTFNLFKRNDIKGGYIAIEGKAKRRVINHDWKNVLHRFNHSKEETIKFTAIPYYLWAHRQAGEMIVWIRSGK